MEPHLVEALAFEAAELVRQDHLSTALTLYNQLQRTNNDDNEHDLALEIREARENVIQGLISKWHFIMLNDHTRHRAYQTALNTVLSALSQPKPNLKVIDVGTGTGILTLMALKAGAQWVMAVENEPFLADLARRVFQANKVEHQVDLRVLMSTELAPRTEIDRFDVLVTETFDAGLLGEGIFRTLDHAWTHLLIPGTSQVIPRGGTLIGVLIERLGSDFSKKLPSSREKMEPYDSGFIRHDLECSRVRMLSEPFKITDVNFQDPNFLRKCLHSGCIVLINVTASKQGTCHEIVVWFDLQMTENQTLTSNPERRDGCWQQAIFSLPHPLPIQKGHTVKMQFSIGDPLTLLNAELEHPVLFGQEPLLHLSNPDVSPLENLIQKLGSRPVHILDCSEIPWTSLNLSATNPNLKVQVLINAQNDDQVPKMLGFITKMVQSKGIASNRVRCLNLDSHLKNLKPRYDIIITDPSTSSGRINSKLLLQFDVLRQKLKPNLPVSDRFFPSTIVVDVFLVNSEFLTRSTFVVDDEHGFRIKEFINEFWTSHFQDITPETLQSCTQTLGQVTFEIGWNDLHKRKLVCQRPVSFVDEGIISAIVYKIRSGNDHANFAAFVRKCPFEIKSQTSCVVKLYLENGLLDLQICSF